MDISFSGEHLPQITFETLVDIHAHQLAYYNFFIQAQCNQSGIDVEGVRSIIEKDIINFRERIQESLYKDYGHIGDIVSNEEERKIDLTKTPESNPEWAAQQMAYNLTKDEIWVVQDALKQLDKILYKSWAKDLTLTELIEAANMAAPTK